MSANSSSTPGWIPSDHMDLGNLSWYHSISQLACFAALCSPYKIFVWDLPHQHYDPWEHASVCHIGIYLKPSQSQQRNAEINPFLLMYNISGLGLLTLFWLLNVNWLQTDFSPLQCIAICSIENWKHFKDKTYQMYSPVSTMVFGISNCYVRMKILKLSFKVSCV